MSGDAIRNTTGVFDIITIMRQTAGSSTGLLLQTSLCTPIRTRCFTPGCQNQNLRQ